MATTDISADNLSFAFLLGLLSLAPAFAPNERVPALLEQLTATDPLVRSKAACELGTIEPKDKRAVLPLIAMLDDDFYLARANAAAALASFQSEAKAAGQRLAAALLDQYAVVRDHAALALNCIRPNAKEVLPYLIQALEKKAVTQASSLADLVRYYAEQLANADVGLLPQWKMLCKKMRNYPHPTIQKIVPTIRDAVARYSEYTQNGKAT